jgi:sporulation protein YqfC
MEFNSNGTSPCRIDFMSGERFFMIWRDFKKQVKRSLTDFFEIPGDVLLNLPKIVLVGNLKVFIENHRGVLEYSPETIRIKLAEGELCVTGEELMLRSIITDEVCIEGKINGLSFCNTLP